LVQNKLPLEGKLLMVSGRSSFEIMQKALAAGIPMVCAVSAPSSLAVDVARRFDMSLIGFLRGSRFNVYAGRERIATAF
jgi:FdhD protein